MDLRTPTVLGLAAMLAGAPLAALADSGPVYFTPPKLKTRGTATSAIVSGTVVVKVFVKADGSIGGTSIVKANPASDGAPALEIAKSSTYIPATRGTKKVPAFYDYTLTFKGQTASTPDEYSSFEGLIAKNQFKDAVVATTTFLNSHANDARALGDLAVADFYVNDYAGAVAALEKGGTVAPNFKAIPINAYAEYVNQQIKAGDFTAASAAAKKLVALQPTFNTENTLGFVELSAKNYADAVTDLQKARDEATSATPKTDPKTIASIDLNLEQALIGAGKIDDAKKLAPEITQLDPARSTASQNVLAQYYSDAGTAKVNAKAYADAATLYEQAAADVPTFASQFYTSAAFMYLQLTPKPDNAKAKADADKAIAADPSNAKANYAAGIALANDGKSSDALTYLKKADDLAKSASPPNAAFVTQVETAIAQVSKAK